jgi:hypothetical protein
MSAMVAPPPPGSALQYPARGRKVSEEDWRFIASLRQRFSSMSFRRFSHRVAQEVGMDPERQHLRDLSHATLWRHRYKLQKLVAELERGAKVATKPEVAVIDTPPARSSTEGVTQDGSAAK